MTEYSKFITEEGKQEILRIAFAPNSGQNGFKYLALGKAGSSAASEGDKEKFDELKGSEYHRISVNDSVTPEPDGTITLDFIVEEDNYNGEGVIISEIALCDSGDTNDDIPSGKSTVFAFCQVPEIEKTGNISLKYTLKISIE